LLFIDDFLEVLHQANDVSHSEHTAGHTFWTERFELVCSFSDTLEDDGGSGDFTYIEGGAAARVAVELREDDAGEAQFIVEAPRGTYGVLTDHRVDDEQDIVRTHGFVDRPELIHERSIDRQATCGIVDDDVVACLHRLKL